MESLLVTFLSVLIAECGDRSQLLSAALAERFGRNWPVIVGVTAAALGNSAFAAFAGSYIHGTISEDPVRLFVGIAYVLAAIAMLTWRRRVNTREKWKTGPFLTSFLGVAFLQFGDKGQFIILANAAKGEGWLWSALGGSFGAMLGIIPAIIFKEKLPNIVPLAKIRKIGGVVFLLYGLFLAMRAWHLL
jgi:Ca2+/H+ antiporter, TMEM165/GDT1 family